MRINKRQIAAASFEGYNIREIAGHIVVRGAHAICLRVHYAYFQIKWRAAHADAEQDDLEGRQQELKKECPMTKR